MIEIHKPVLEKLIFHEIYEIVKRSLDSSQHGFRSHWSIVTTTAFSLCSIQTT